MPLRSKVATPATKNDVKNISDKLDKISKSFVDNSTSLLHLTEEIKELRKSQQFLSEQYEDMKQMLHPKDEEVKVLQVENQYLKLHVCKLEAVTSKSHEEVNDLEQYGRRECLEFQGLAWNKNTDDLVLHASRMVGMDLKGEEISVSHRLSPASDKNPQSTIIARFCSRKNRDAVFSQRHRLRSHNKAHPKGRIFINESLTKINRRRFNLCLQFKKKKNIKFIWTNHGLTYLRDSEGAKAMAIKTEDDLVKYGIVKSWFFFLIDTCF